MAPVDRNMLECLKTGEFTDASIVCGEDVFRVHKIVLLLFRSHYFSTILRSGFQESQTSIITLEDQDPSEIARMLYWMYTGEYAIDGACCTGFFQGDDTYKAACTEVPTLVHNDNDALIYVETTKVHVAMYAAAVRFDIVELQKSTVAEFRGVFLDRVNSDLVEELSDTIIGLVWTTTPESARGLRDVVVEEILDWRYGYDADTKGPGPGRICRAVRANPAIAADVATCYFDDSLGPEEECPSCGSKSRWQMGSTRSRLRRPSPEVYLPRTQRPDKRPLSGVHASDVKCKTCGLCDAVHRCNDRCCCILG